MDLSVFSFNNIFALLQQMSVFLVIAYLFTKSPFFRSFSIGNLDRRQVILLYFFFSFFSILGTYFGMPINDAIANTRAIGAVLAGIIGGPLLGTAVGFTAGLHRYTLGGFTAFSCGISTTIEGLIGGLVHVYLVKQDKQSRLLSPKIAFFTTLVAEILQMCIILVLAQPFDQSLALVRIIALPMILANSTGAAIFVSIIRDQKSMYDELSVIFSAKALKIAERTLSILTSGLNMETAREVAAVIHEETGVGAVAITDRERVLAFIGTGSDHHHTGQAISSPQTLQAIKEDRIIYADGVEKRWQCVLSENCPLGSALSVPLRVDNELIGTVNLFEPKNKLFLVINKTLGEGITNLLADQILYSRYVEQKNLLTTAELKLVQAQVNPHFLFNALNTVIAIIRKDAGRARDLLLHLSNFLRKNLKRTSDIATLKEELDHVNSYLVIEKARFEDKLNLKMDIDPDLLSIKLPVFTLQPIIENAIKHGISNMLGPGMVRISAIRTDGVISISVEDNGGNYSSQSREGLQKGLGMNIVEKRIKNLCGDQYGLSVSCDPQDTTLVTITLPEKGCRES